MRQIPRREMLRHSALFAAGTALAGSVARADDKPGDETDAKPASANDALRVAVVGVRGRGMDHVGGFIKQPGARIVAICDADENVIGKANARIEEAYGQKPKYYQDLRKLLEDKSIDIISVATPNHWHALATVWACQAGKDVYVEKPVSHNVWEGRKMVDAARKYERIVQTGTQCRSHKGIQDAMKFLHEGGIGKLYMAKGLCYKPRGSIGLQKPTDPPKGLDYDLWTGPAQPRPFRENTTHYNWHWMWSTGNGDLGNQGIHQMDLARWGINKNEFPKTVISSGGRLGYKDDGETPNTQFVEFEFDDCLLQFEVRGLLTNDEKGVRVGNIFYGSEGVLTITSYQDWQTYMGPKGEPGPKGSGSGDHYANFLDAVRSRDPKRLSADIEEGHLSSAYCHLGNIAYRLGRKLHINPSTESFVNDSEADGHLTREYRAPFVVPSSV